MPRDDACGARTSRWARTSATGVANLQLAVDELGRTAGVCVVAVSRVYETAPVGGPPQDAYLNAVVAVDTELAPLDLLHACHRIEALAARERTVRWGPRTLDVDVLLVGDQRVDTEELTSRTRACGSADSCSLRCGTSPPASSTQAQPGRAFLAAGVTLTFPPVA